MGKTYCSYCVCQVLQENLSDSILFAVLLAV